MSTDVGELLHWADGLQKASGRLGAEVAGELRETGEIVAELGAENAPVGETGELSTEIEVTREGSGRASDMFVHVIYLADHAHFVHYGTSRQPPNPFADRALAAEEPAHLDRLRRIVEEVIPDE